MAGTATLTHGASILTVSAVTGPEFSRPSKLRQLVQSSRLNLPHLSRIRVARAGIHHGDRFGALGGSSSPGPSNPPLHAVPTQTSDAPLTSFPNSLSSLVTTVPGDLGNEAALERFYKNNVEAEQMNLWIEEIREMFRSMNDGEITTSPYDTAWVARVPALDGSKGPQFPKAVQWIIDNQFADGTWGDADYYSYFDRTINTLGCIIALKTWDTGAASVERGQKFLQENLQKMDTEEDEHMPIGFEIVFPAMVNDARKLGLDLPYDAPVIASICAEGEKKLKKIPMDIIHKFPTTLLHSLEGIHEQLDWEKLVKLQSEDGSFLASPASTAACLLHTKDEKALGYLNGLLGRFGNATTNVYPVDLFERMWVVDRLERLGIAHYFHKEIKHVLDYVYKNFPEQGIAWASKAPVQDLDDTSMGFRLLRRHGYDVNERVFRQFRGPNGDFVCFAGQSGQAVTGLFNFYRATQTRLPGEELLEGGEKFARDFLLDKHAKKECFDKWIITKDLAGEVKYALDTPWYCSLPRLETRSYLDQYGPDDIWIGKTLYRMPNVNNNTFLALAKADFNLCQSIHQQDLQAILRWSKECKFETLSFARQKCNEAMFTAACLHPAPEHASARIVWAQNCVLTTVVDDFFDVGGALPDLLKFFEATKRWDPSLMEGAKEEAKITFNGLYNSINGMTQQGFFAQARDIGQHLREIWLRWIESCLIEAEWTASGHWPSFEEYLEVAKPSIALEPIVLCTMFFLGEPVSDKLINDPKKLYLMELVNRAGRLLNDIQGHKRETLEGKRNAVSILLRENPEWTEVEAIAHVQAMVQEDMLNLVREVHQPCHIPVSIKQMHFNMARVMQLFYQRTDGFTSKTAMKSQMQRVLCEPVS